MRHIANRFTATLDANVLYPFLVRDVLLSFADAGLYRPVWSQEIQNEWSSHLIAGKPDKREQIIRTIRVMNRAFPEAMVDGYEDLTNSISLPDPDDRHVLAVAIRSGSSVIVTQNIKDFPQEVMSQYDIEALTADEFALRTMQLYMTDAVAALRGMRERYDRPSMTAQELLVALAATGLVATTAELQPHAQSM